MKLALPAAVMVCMFANTLRADFTYEQTNKITGGAMAGMIKVASAFSKKLREPMKSTIIVKGDRMAQFTGTDSVHIIDLARETFTDVDLQKRTYTVMTFADMQRAMEAAARKAQQERSKSGDPNAEMSFKVSVKNTGATKQVNGFDTKEAIMILAIEGKDQKTGESGNMAMTSDMWLAPKVSGYDEVMNFHKRMAEKLNWSGMAAGFQAMLAQQPGANKGFAEMAKEMSKLNGIPVYQVIRMGVATNMAEAEKMATAPTQQVADMPSAGDVAGKAAGNAAGNAAEGAATGAIAGRMGKLGGLAGGLGGFGGLGRKKKQQEEAQQAPPQETRRADAQQPGNGVFMEMTSELTTFSSAPVDSAKLEVPAGFKQVESQMEKELKKGK